MKFLVLTLVVAAVYARPEVSEISGSYLPGVTGGSSILSTGIDGFGSSGVGIGGTFGSIGGTIGGIGGANLAQDHRHVFFYAASDDEAPARFRVNIAPSSARNTKIIFVKAPSYGGVIPEVIAPPSQHLDRTLVYVLVKKPQGGGQITIPSSLGVRQSKPEVYFVKYRNQAEAEQAVVSGLSGHSVGSGLSDLGNEGYFIRTVGGFRPNINVQPILFIGRTKDEILFDGTEKIFRNLAVLSGTTGGGFGTGGTSTIRYGTPGASGPYKR